MERPPRTLVSLWPPRSDSSAGRAFSLFVFQPCKGLWARSFPPRKIPSTTMHLIPGFTPRPESKPCGLHSPAEVPGLEEGRSPSRAVSQGRAVHPGGGGPWPRVLSRSGLRHVLQGLFHFLDFETKRFMGQSFLFFFFPSGELSFELSRN